MHGYMILVYPARIGYHFATRGSSEGNFKLCAVYYDLKPGCRLPENMPLPTLDPVKRPIASYAKKSAPSPKEHAPCDERSGDEDDEPPSDVAQSDSDSSVESETSDTSITECRARRRQQMDPSSSSKQK